MEELLDRIQTALMMRFPFLSSLLREARIIVSEAVPTAAVSPRGWVYIRRSWFEKLDFKTQVFVLAHEVLHAANLHAARGEGKDRVMWNVATDCVVNELLGEVFYIRSGEWITADTISSLTGKKRDEVLPMSDLEIYELLKRRCKSVRVKLYPSPDGDLLDGERDGETVQAGGEFNDRTGEENREGWRRAIAKAYTAQRMAGKLPAGLERWVNSIIKPRINPKTLIKQNIRNGIGRLVINTWRRTSRKIPDLPGNRMLTVPTIWVLVDTSGSITEQELRISLGACLEFSHIARVNVICWDAEAYETIPVRQRGNVLNTVARRIRGGGGTVIAPVLRRVLEQMRPRDVVVVVTDGHIWDMDERETKELLAQVASKSGTAIFCYHDREHQIPGWVSVKLEPANGFWR